MGVSLTRYPFPVPEWSRVIWASAGARELWQPRLTQIGNAWNAVERASVGLFRQAARQSIAPDQFSEFSRKAAATGRVAVALRKESSGASYQATPTQLAPGAPWAFQTALCATPAAAKSFLLAWEGNDDQAIGELLGFPPCCIAFFRRVWNSEKWMDTSWPMGVNTLGDYFVSVAPSDHALSFPATTPLEVNILLRWIGVRWVPHLPCSFDCVGSQALGQNFRSLMSESHPQEAAWIDELLDSPIEWSAWHGIAEVKHPLFKISAKTDATRERLSVRRAGARYPEGAPTGNAFPYRRPGPAPTPLTFHRPTDWTDNGFGSLEEMTRAHDAIVEFYRTEVEPRHDVSVIDLGCGNGRLVSRLSKKSWGVESDAARARRAKGPRLVYDMTIEQFVESKDSEMGLAVAVLMPGRLLEMSPESATKVRAWLRANAGQVLVYAYGDWAQRYGGLLGLCRAAGLTLSPKSFSLDKTVDVGLLDMEAEW